MMKNLKEISFKRNFKKFKMNLGGCCLKGVKNYDKEVEIHNKFTDLENALIVEKCKELLAEMEQVRRLIYYLIKNFKIMKSLEYRGFGEIKLRLSYMKFNLLNNYKKLKKKKIDKKGLDEIYQGDVIVTNKMINCNDSSDKLYKEIYENIIKQKKS